MKKFKRIYIEITNICNLKCDFCPETARKKENMSINVFEKIIEKVNDYTDYIYLHVKGEPLLYPELEQILDICSEYKKQVIITTNGVLLNEKKEMLVTKPAVRQINISLHATKKTFDNEIKYINENSNIIVQLRNWNMKNRVVHSAKLKNNVYASYEEQFVWPDLKKEKIISSIGTCYGLRSQIGILVDGTVVPCCLDNNGDINLGNILNEDLKDILESKKAREIKKGFLEGRFAEELCKKCGYANRYLE